jgi:uncharacterized membrane protein
MVQPLLFSIRPLNKNGFLAGLLLFSCLPVGEIIGPGRLVLTLRPSIGVAFSVISFIIRKNKVYVGAGLIGFYLNR